MEVADLDGFNVYDNLPLRTYRDFVDLVVPELQRRGRVPTSHPAQTLRANLTGGGARLPENHAGAGYRRAAAGVS